MDSLTTEQFIWTELCFQVNNLVTHSIDNYIINTNTNGLFTTLIHSAYLNSPLNYNFIVVDWGLLSGNVHFDNLIEQFEIYKTVVSTNIPIVANRTAEFIKFLGVDPSTVHLVGHSLGAHVSGNTGRNYQSLTNGKKLARITGLDPAGPLFLLPRFPFPKIHRGNADFVDVIHTCMGELGDVAMDGDVDFFPNGGVNQPGCDFLQGCMRTTLLNIYNNDKNHEIVFHSANVEFMQSSIRCKTLCCIHYEKFPVL